MRVTHLHEQADEQLADGPEQTEPLHVRALRHESTKKMKCKERHLEQQNSERGREQQHVHFDGERHAVPEAGPRPLVAQRFVHSPVPARIIHLGNERK